MMKSERWGFIDVYKDYVFYSEWDEKALDSFVLCGNHNFIKKKIMLGAV